MKNGLRKEEIEHFRDNSKKTAETPPIPTPKTPKKHPCQHTPRYLYHLSHQPNYQRKPYRKNTDTRVSDSELNRHGLFPLPGGNCISTLLNGNQRTARFLQDKRR